MKCLIKIDELSDPFGNFFCGKIDEDQRLLQEEFSSLFAGNKDQIVSYRVKKIDEVFAVGSANYIYTGFMWIAKNIDGEWQIISRGQDIPFCSDMEKYEVPKSIYETCYDEETQAQR